MVAYVACFHGSTRMSLHFSCNSCLLFLCHRDASLAPTCLTVLNTLACISGSSPCLQCPALGLADTVMSAKPTEEARPQVNSEDVVARIGEAIRNHLAQATEEERQRCVEQLAEWCSERETKS